MRKGGALRCKKQVFALYMLQFKIVSRSRNLMETGIAKGIPNLSKLTTLRQSYFRYLGGGFNQIEHLMSFGFSKNRKNKLYICKFDARGSSAVLFGRGGAEGGRGGAGSSHFGSSLFGKPLRSALCVTELVGLGWDGCGAV